MKKVQIIVPLLALLLGAIGAVASSAIKGNAPLVTEQRVRSTATSPCNIQITPESCPGGQNPCLVTATAGQFGKRIHLFNNDGPTVQCNPLFKP